MIAKECAPSPAREETKKEVPEYDSSFKNINLSDSSVSTNYIRDLEGKILTYLCEHKGWISTCRLFEKLGLEILGMNAAARAIHNLGRRGIIEIRANAVRAARGIRRVKE